MCRVGQAAAMVIVGATSVVPVAAADYSFPAFDLGGSQATTNTWKNRLLDTAGVPSGSYTGYRLVMNWSSNFQGDSAIYAWSSEPRIAFASGQAFGSPVLQYGFGETQYSDIGFPSNGATNANNVTGLTIEGSFLTPYTSGPLYWNYRQFEDGSNFVTWSNIRITLVPAPGAAALVLLAAAGLGLRRRRVC